MAALFLCKKKQPESHHSHQLPNTLDCPDPEHSKSLSRLGNDITELAAHLDAGTFQLLELIGHFDENGGWHG
jgi:hypothetical protein